MKKMKKEMKKYFQIDDRGLLRQIVSCDLCPASGEEDGQCRVVHQHLPARGLEGVERTLHHEDASAHNANAALDYLKEKSRSAGHRPSPDLAPCDSFLFPTVKQQLKQLQDVEDARAFFEGVISDIPQLAWSGVWCHGHMV